MVIEGLCFYLSPVFTFNFCMPSYGGTEGTTVSVCVTADGTLDRDINVTVTGSPSSMINMSFRYGCCKPPPLPVGGDYSIASPDITFPNGSNTSQCVDVSITDDMSVEDPETVTLGLSSTDSDIETMDTATLEITDNDSMFN